MIVQTLKKSSYLLLALLLANGLMWQSCGSVPDAGVADSSNLISENILNTTDTVPYEVPIPDPDPPKKERKRRSSGGGSGSGGSDNSQETVFDNYVRGDDNPESLARAAQHKIIQMLYPDAYQKASTRLLSNKENSKGEWVLEVEIEWRDRWSKKPYQIKATITVGKGGENAVIAIIGKNPEAESLEFTYKSFKDQDNIGNI